MRSERLYLEDIAAACDAIARFLSGCTEASFRTDELRQSAVLHQLMVIGEAASKLSREFREQNPNVPWADIVGFRNFAIHAYFQVQLPVVWTAATEDAPHLRQSVRNILSGI